MTSPTKITAAQTRQLLQWMEAAQPKVLTGLVRRFTPKGTPLPKAQLSGFLDSLGTTASSVVNGITNFFNSNGAQAMMGAATPFLQTALEKQQLELNIKRMQSGLMPQAYAPGYAPSAYPGYVPPVSTPGTYQPYSGQLPPGYPLPPQEKPLPWGWIGAAAGLGLLLMSRSGGGRR
jgi:hypothetical protein